MFMGEDEIRCRLAAGFLLLVGILSLLLSLDRPDRETKLARAVETVTAGIDRAGIATHSLVEMEKRRQAMERDNTTTGSAAGTMDFTSPENRARPAIDATGGTREDLATSVSVSAGRIREKAEELIRLYPWPTLMLGLGLGYVLARRRW
jgi:hypothetical protein